MHASVFLKGSVEPEEQGRDREGYSSDNCFCMFVSNTLCSGCPLITFLVMMFLHLYNRSDVAFQMCLAVQVPTSHFFFSFEVNSAETWRSWECCSLLSWADCGWLHGQRDLLDWKYKQNLIVLWEKKSFCKFLI